MPIANGSNEIAAIYNGENAISKIYKGNDLVYLGEPDPIPFIFTHAVTTNTESQTITVSPTGYTYDFDIDWGDGTKETYTNSSLGESVTFGHTYSNLSTYTVTISRKWSWIKFGKKWKIESIIQWGNGWESLAELFGNSKASAQEINLPIFPPNNKVLSAQAMFRCDPDSNKNDGFKLILPDGLFKNLKRCVNFSQCFLGQYEKNVGESNNRLRIKGQIFPDNANDLSEAFGGARFFLPSEGVSASSLPEDFLYNLTKVTSLESLFTDKGSSNSIMNGGAGEITLPKRWLPKNLSNCLNFNNLFNRFTSFATSTGFVANPIGTMETVWNRADINPNAEKSFAFIGAKGLSNYDSIPMEWGGVLEEVPTATLSEGTWSALISGSKITLSTKTGFTTWYYATNSSTLTPGLDFYDNFIQYTEPIVVQQIGNITSYFLYFAYKRNSDGKFSLIEIESGGITASS